MSGGITTTKATAGDRIITREATKTLFADKCTFIAEK